MMASTMGRDDPEMQMLWSPMSHEGHARYAALRDAIRRGYAPSAAPPSQTQRLRDKYAAGARRSGDAIFFETFGSPEQLLRADEDDELCAELLVRGTAIAASQTSRCEASRSEPEREPMTTTTSAFGVKTVDVNACHVSQLAKPTRLRTPKRFSLKRTRGSECSSAEKDHAARKPRLMLADTTNLMNMSTTTTTMTNPWDRHHASKPSSMYTNCNVAKPFRGSRFGPSPHQPVAAVQTTSAFASTLPRPTHAGTSTITSTRAFALR